MKKKVKSGMQIIESPTIEEALEIISPIVTQQMKMYREANKDKLAEKNKAYREANKALPRWKKLATIEKKYEGTR